MSSNCPQILSEIPLYLSFSSPLLLPLLSPATLASLLVQKLILRPLFFLIEV